MVFGTSASRRRSVAAFRLIPGIDAMGSALPPPSDSMLAVQHWLGQHKTGDDSALKELMEVSMRRLHLLARRILQDIPVVRRFEESDDLLQNSVVRLWKYLSSHQPETPVDYFRLAACLIRRELIDLSRHHFGPHGSVGVTDTHHSEEGESANLARCQAVGNDDSFNPQKLSQWTEFHEYIESLADEDRALFDLLWYQGLTMAETSALLNVPLRTLGRRWKMARVRLYRDLLGDPEDEIPV